MLKRTVRIVTVDSPVPSPPRRRGMGADDVSWPVSCVLLSLCSLVHVFETFLYAILCSLSLLYCTAAVLSDETLSGHGKGI